MRASDKNTKEELLRSLKYIFSFEEYSFLSEEEISSLTKDDSSLFRARKHIEYDEPNNRVLAAIYSTNDSQAIVSVLSFDLYQPPESNDLDFGNYFCRVFNEDLNTSPNAKSHHELWQTLRQTQFRRAIAKYSAFSTTPMTNWLQVVESTTSLRYEGKPFTYCLFMTKQEQWIKGAMEDYFVDFSTPIKFEQGMMSEKWIRAAVDGDRVGLVGLGHSGDLVGIFNIPPLNNSEKWPVAPHISMVPLQQFLINGTCLFVASEQGDIYFLLPNGAIFQKTQGRWHYLNYNHILNVLSGFVSQELAVAILRLALDLSYERYGALIVIPDSQDNVGNIVPDHTQKQKANRPLRESIARLNILAWPHRQIIMASAKSDGALILSNNGSVLDVACMIGEPGISELNSCGIQHLKRFSGARSTAAWNASIQGVSIKVSEDGPITIYRHGNLVAQVG
ncbi:diadenylate cyclase [Saccharophagus degradans]|uniref:Diadenylate cyclase n=1 Tax=Saccharophagus degradans TaxID=86304 RepID=A0AAW7X4V2_9GAMM|nr:diadenylate cyclase [Saccharophagus degradans]MDO6421543.1 diadenylate cyclase [Saccharophagus degradans]MDO6608505.1 diadenylate cyclase [Saccharophagus degradans]